MGLEKSGPGKSKQRLLIGATPHCVTACYHAAPHDSAQTGQVRGVPSSYATRGGGERGFNGLQERRCMASVCSHSCVASSSTSKHRMREKGIEWRSHPYTTYGTTLGWQGKAM